MSITRYKLTDQDMRTYNGFQWTLGVKASVEGDDKELCSASWLHCYDDPVLALLLNPIHANIAVPRLFAVRTEGRGLNDRGLKRGYKAMTLVKELPLPNVTWSVRTAFGILCAMEVYKVPAWNRWAQAWLNGMNRIDVYAAANAAAYAYAAARVYANARANAYVNANAAYARAAAYAAYAAADAVRATRAAVYAAHAAADAAAAATLPLVQLANSALAYAK